MRVAMYYCVQDIRIEEMPVPSIGPGEMLVRVRASGICGSDVMEWYRARAAPLVLGHEIAGEVAAVGEGVSRFRVGRPGLRDPPRPLRASAGTAAGPPFGLRDPAPRRTSTPGDSRSTSACPGSTCERGTLPLPEELSFDEGSFIEPVACVVRGQRMARLQAGQTVLVIGSGTAGLLHVQLAKARGAARVVASDIHESRLQAARGWAPTPPCTPRDLPQGLSR